MTGHGKMERSNGYDYVGEVLIGRPHGWGRMTWREEAYNGAYYEGDFI